MSKKLKVGIIFGGRSGEHDVSLNSAQSVMNALDKSRYDIVPIGITRSGKWITGGAVAALTGGSDATRPAALLAGAGTSALMQFDTESRMSAAADLDVVIPVLHGTYGEDGTVQGLLELANVPYVGAGVVGSAVGMDKAIFKAVMQAHGIPILPWQLVRRADWQANGDLVIAEVEAALRYPVFTKPANLGSSVGICKCANRAELIHGLHEAARFDRRIVVEQGIDARELEVSVLGNDEPIASIVGEIRPKRAFYDYVAKYISDDSDLLIPAPISAELSDRIRRLAVDAFQAIDCAGLGRVDFLLDRTDDAVYINEINTIPGFTHISMYPKLWEATGISYSELLDRLIELALDRFAEKATSTTIFDPAALADQRNQTSTSSV
ncbi:MAG: D-alanine--D-alanine ligase [Anaerolineae bacterium]|nr:D-alanine--D-alanine ligase [Anaerolineae bacterium]MCO5192923.1 D-alanine--D-alanine ligase [Anaerolineae bacterium]